jgi:hypothetical protein
MQDKRQMQIKHGQMSASMSALPGTKTIGLNDEIPKSRLERSQLGSFIRFNNSFADSTLSFSDTSTCAMSGDGWLQEESDDMAISFEDFARMAGVDICKESLVDHIAVDGVEDNSMAKSKKKKTKKLKDINEVKRSRRIRASRRSSWNGSQIPENSGTLNQIPLQIFQNSLSESLEEYADREYVLPKCEDEYQSKANITCQEDSMKNFRSISPRSTLVDDTSSRGESTNEISLIRTVEFVSKSTSQEKATKQQGDANRFHQSRASVLSEATEKVANYLEVSSEANKVDFSEWEKRNSTNFCNADESISHYCMVDSLRCGNIQYSPPDDPKPAAACEKTVKPLCRQKSSSTVDSSTSYASQKSKTYVMNLKDTTKSWVSKEDYEVDFTKDLKLKRSTIRGWKSGYSKSRLQDLDLCGDIVLVSSACMPQESNIASLENLDLEAELCLQLTAFGGVTVM